MIDPTAADKFNFMKGQPGKAPGMAGIPMLADGKTPDVPHSL